MVFRTLKHCFDILNASLEDAILKEHHIPKGIRATYQKKKKGIIVQPISTLPNQKIK